ncbi:MAG: uroporphyrinogen decarboxylase family protein [Clostridia bacterium]|nr:uroporphyrinogen decarboxylase family protein [Clostridia bacterium]
MKTIVQNIIENKNKTVPILSFPSTKLLSISVNDLISSADNQAKGMKAIAERCSIGASLNMMDLSVEAEAFGAKIHFSENEIPTVIGGIIDDIEDVSRIAVPQTGAGRTGIFIDGVKIAKDIIADIPVFCGVIGPYSLASRLFDMTELMYACYDSPDEVKILLEKAAEFIINYINAFKAVGADGVIMAEPAAGMLSPTFADEFSVPFVKRIFDAVNSDVFVLCYHNCGNYVADMLEGISTVGADIYHFGNAVDIKKALDFLPNDRIVMGNVDPLLLRTGTPECVSAEVERIFNECSSYPNFMISTGCDVPADAKWENIDAYFKKVNELYA